MAMTHDYLDFLNERVGISPANSQEELQAAQVVSDLMSQHNVEPRVEDFEAPALSGVFAVVPAAAMFLGVLVSGFGVLVLTLVGLVLAALPAVLSLLRAFGREVSLSLGPRAQSQNVVAVHRATGPLVTKGSRTIVLVAHYDSPRENFLASSPVAPYLTMIHRAQVPCFFAVPLCALVQLLGFLPAPVRVIVWVVGILAALPALLTAVGAIAERFAPCTLGANDNKASVAALLGVMENVRPSGAVPRAREFASEPGPEQAGDQDAPAEPAEDGRGVSEQAEAIAEEPLSAPEPRDVPDAESAPETPAGTRRGPDILRSLGILPESCEIVYVAEAAPAPGETAILERHESAPRVETEEAHEDLRTTGRLSVVEDEDGYGVGPQDTTGVVTIADDASADQIEAEATMPTAPVERPEAPSDPEWGKTSFRPQLSSVARRASLFDLPDPSGEEVDPLDLTDPSATRVQAPQPDVPAPAAPVAPLPTITSEDLDEVAHKSRGGLRGLVGRLRRRGAGGEEDDEARGRGSWRGGAATRGGLRLVEDEAAPTDDELRDAALSLGDDSLVAHDIWFVALGGSSLDHAGMRSFLSAHRSEVRGCFVINLDCVGAGALTVLRNEGLEETRRGDRRVTRLLMGAASDLHIDLAQAPHDWADTDVTPAMRSSLRSVTIMGVDDNGLPALSHTSEDVPENVSGDQAAQVAALVTEMIRRS